MQDSAGSEGRLLNDQASTPAYRQAVRPRISATRSLLEWAIKRSGKSVESLSKSNGMEKVEEWLNGKTQPTLRQMEAFANATYTPLGYLLLAEPPQEAPTIPYFRTAGGDTTSRPSLDLVETIKTIKHRQDWMRDRLIADGNDRLGYVGSAKHTDPVRDAALSMRKELDITEEWASGLDSWTDALKTMRDKMEDIGVFVSVSGIVGSNTRRALQVKEFRGFVLVDDYAPFVFVNGADARAAQMFTLAHELAHVWLGRSAAFDLHRFAPANDPVEKACNRIAAEFLVPGEEMRQNWDKFGDNDARYKHASRHFKVSRIVTARRALDLGLISKDMFLDFYNKEYRPDVKSEGRGGGNYYANVDRRIGRRFAQAVINAVRQEAILYREAYSLTKMKRDTFERYAKWMEERTRGQL